MMILGRFPKCTQVLLQQCFVQPRGAVLRRHDGDTNIDMTADYESLDHRSQYILEGIERSPIVEVQIQTTMVHAFHIDYNLAMLASPVDLGETGHAAYREAHGLS